MKLQEKAIGNEWCYDIDFFSVTTAILFKKNLTAVYLYDINDSQSISGFWHSMPIFGNTHVVLSFIVCVLNLK